MSKKKLSKKEIGKREKQSNSNRTSAQSSQYPNLITCQEVSDQTKQIETTQKKKSKYNLYFVFSKLVLLLNASFGLKNTKSI